MIDPRSLTADDAGRSVVYPYPDGRVKYGELQGWDADKMLVWVVWEIGGKPLPEFPYDLEWALADDEVEAT